MLLHRHCTGALLLLALFAGCATPRSTMNAPSPLSTARLIGIVATTDAPASRAFYEGKLGATVVSEDNLALILDSHGSMIRIQKLKTFTPQQFTVMGWNVDDLEATVTALEARGVHCEQYGFPVQDARGIATFPNGDKVAWLKDPAGNVISFAQLVPVAGAK